LDDEGDDTDELEDEEVDETEFEADEEVDTARQASDEQEIQELVDGVDADVRFFVGASDLELGRSAMIKVCGNIISVKIQGLTSSPW
jgi:hypothetical protein